MGEDKLPPAELDVLACLWDHGELTAREIRERLHKQRPMTHSAVSSFLSRLMEKGLIVRVKGPIGKAYLYRAAASPGQKRRRIIGDLLKRVFNGDLLSATASLFETRAPTSEEIERLQQLIDQLKQDQRRKERS